MTRVSLLTATALLAGTALGREVRSPDAKSGERTIRADDPQAQSGETEYHYTKPAALPGANASQGDLYDYWSTLVGKESRDVARLGACPKPNPTALAVDRAVSEGDFVKKTVFDGPTLLYVVGLEGAGHHFWMTMHNGTLKKTPKEVDDSIRGLISARRMLCGEEGAAAADCRRPPDNWLDAERKRTKKALEHFRSMAKGIYSAGPGFWSYPFHRDGPRAIFEHPDVGMLAQLAEDAGVDIRFLVTTRNADSMLQSDVSHRHFCTGDDAMERQADYLAHNARVLKTQLERIDKGFFVHSNFDELPAVADDLRDFYETKLSLPRGAWQDRAHHVYARHSKHAASFISNKGMAYINELRKANDEVVRIAKYGRELIKDQPELIKDQDELIKDHHILRQSTA
jgi:hypothetical protein